VRVNKTHKTAVEGSECDDNCKHTLYCHPRDTPQGTRNTLDSVPTKLRTQQHTLQPCNDSQAMIAAMTTPIDGCVMCHVQGMQE
jgi:hypothetical protein